MKKLWRSLNGVLGEVDIADTAELTAEDFAKFFTDKVEAVRSSTASTPLYDVPMCRRIHSMSGVLFPPTRWRNSSAQR